MKHGINILHQSVLINWNETYALDENGNQVYNIGDGYAGFKRVQTDDEGNILYNKTEQRDVDGISELFLHICIHTPEKEMFW